MRRHVPIVADALLAGVLVLLTQLELWLSPSLDTLLRDARSATLPFAILAPAAVFLRRRSPLLAVAGAAGAVVGQAIIVAPVVLLSQVAALLVVVYSAAAHDSLARSLAGFGVACSAPATLALMTGAEPQEFASIVLFAGAPWVAGRSVCRVRRYVRRLEEVTADLEAERERSAAVAVSAERGRIARELHDVLAHGLSVMTLHAGGARRVVERDPDRATRALQTVESIGRQSLSEMRRLLNVLDVQSEDSLASGSKRSLLEVDALVRDAAEFQPVVLRVDGEQRPLPVGVDLAAYRIVQEGLTNAVKHAAGAATSVVVSYLPDAVEVRVQNGGVAPLRARPDSRGRGLVGMRERVALHEGIFEAGRTATGGFQVRAVLPVRNTYP